MLPWTGIAVRKTFLISLGGFVMRKVIFTGLIFAFGRSSGARTASSADVAELLERAKKGEPEAQYGLAERYRKGDGVPKNAEEAEQWYRKAAEKGSTDAQSTLGKMYRTGEGVPQNNAEAAKWYRKAAEQGAPDAQSTLGKMYRNGEGVPKNSAEAAKWYREAVKWYRKAAEQGDANAQHGLGIMYHNGFGVERDDNESSMWFRKAAEQGYYGNPREFPAPRQGLDMQPRKAEHLRHLARGQKSCVAMTPFIVPLHVPCPPIFRSTGCRPAPGAFPPGRERRSSSPFAEALRGCCLVPPSAFPYPSR